MACSLHLDIFQYQAVPFVSLSPPVLVMYIFVWLLSFDPHHYSCNVVVLLLQTSDVPDCMTPFITFLQDDTF